ncbi:MAG: hypothetical protein LQ338_006975 [Usnochroma carphineum]|nr:MAG: hypothetical protein LQ338_006975 [Usnochroma carphineum]
MTVDYPTAWSTALKLAVGVSELKRDLEIARSSLKDAREQVDKYKAISQTSEEELQSLNDAQELYRQDMDKIVEEKNAKILELEQRISDIHAELTSTNTELTVLRTKEAETKLSRSKMGQLRQWSTISLPWRKETKVQTTLKEQLAKQRPVIEEAKCLSSSSTTPVLQLLQSTVELQQKERLEAPKLTREIQYVSTASGCSNGPGHLEDALRLLSLAKSAD